MVRIRRRLPHRLHRTSILSQADRLADESTRRDFYIGQVSREATVELMEGMVKIAKTLPPEHPVAREILILVVNTDQMIEKSLAALGILEESNE